MGTTAQKLKKLLDNKRAIRDAITEKTGEDAGEVMSTYAEKIMAIEGGGTKYFRTTILLDQTITDPATMITKVYDDGGISQIRLNSHRYVCKLVDGVMQAKQLRDDQGKLYLDGTLANLTGAEGDVMMKLPQFYYRATEQETDKWLIDFVYGEMPDESYEVWDGKDFIGVYEAYVNSNTVYSRSGVASTANVSQANFKTYARNRGEGYTLVKWKHHCIMAMLFFAWYENTYSRSICGEGTSTQKKTGGTDLLGMEDTAASINGNSQSINFWGLENWWGNYYEVIDNVLVNPVSANGVWRITEDDGLERDVQATTTNGYLSKLVMGENIDAVASEANGSTTSGFCGQFYYNGSTEARVWRSCSGNDANGGLTALFTLGNDIATYTNCSSRLAYRGEYETFDGVFDSEYQEIEYFEGDGNQYIDTGFKPNNNSKITVSASVLSLDGDQYIYGAKDTNSTKAFICAYSEGTITFGYGSNFPSSSVSMSIGEKFIVEQDGSKCFYNGTLLAQPADAVFQTPCNLYLCARNNENAVTKLSKVRVYSCKIYDNGSLVRNYIPYVRKADGVRGLWDKVNKTFITPTSI